jgi:transposase
MEEHFTNTRVDSQSSGLFWGVDIAADTLDLGCFGRSNVRTFENSDAGIASLVSEVSAEPMALIVVEATGGYETPLLIQLVNAGLPVVLVNPRQLRAFATAIGELAKTDTIDARVIARFGHDVCPPIRPLPSQKQRLFADLAARRRQLLELRTAEKNRRQQTTQPELLASIEAVIQLLDEQLAAFDKQIEQQIQTDAVWQQRDRVVRSFKGIGSGTSHALIADLPELGRLGHKQISKLVGVAPLNRDSGKQRGKRVITGGRATVRSALYMAAFNAIRCNPVIKPFYQRLRQAGKSFKVAITACMHKILTILNAIVRDNKLWTVPEENLAPAT